MTDLTDKQIKQVEYIDKKLHETCGMGNHIFLDFFSLPINISKQKVD